VTLTTADDLKGFVRDVHDFPKPGIVFKDITPLLNNPTAFKKSIDLLAERYQDASIDTIIAAEARGFIFAAPLALELGVGFVPVRKPGKLPYERHSFSYELEYGTDTLEMHIDGVEAGQNVLIVDDLLATGGTVEACCKMVEQCDANVHECAFFIELGFLSGAERLSPHETFSLIQY